MGPAEMQVQASGLLPRPLTCLVIVCHTKRNLIIGIDPHTTTVGLRQANVAKLTRGTKRAY